MKRVLLLLIMVLGIALTGCSKTASPLASIADNGSIPIPTISDVSYKDSSTTIQWSISDTSDIAYFELYVKSPKSKTYSPAIIISANVTSITNSQIFSDGVGEYLFVLSAVNVKNEQGRSSNIYRFNFQGYKVSVSSWSSFGLTALDGPESVAVSSSKRIFIADTNHHRILEVSSTGELVHEFGSQGSGKGQFFSPMGLAVDSKGRVILADSNNDRIVRFDPDNFSGTFVTLSKISGGLPATGSGLGEFNFPVSCAVGPSGEIYVSDLLNARIQKIVLANDTGFNGATVTLFDIGSISAREIATTSSRIYILDNNGHLFVKKYTEESDFSVNLKAQAQANGLSSIKTFRGIAIDETNQEILISSEDSDRVLVFSFSGALRAAFGSTGSDSGSFNGPAGMCFKDSKLYVAEKGNNRIQVFQ